jgi:hypothetical protein
LLPPELVGAVALPLREGVSRPHALVSTRFGWDIELVMETELRCDGTLSEHAVRSHRGGDDMAMRSGFRSMLAAERERWVREEFENVIGEKLDLSVTLRGVEESTTPVQIETRVEYPGEPSNENSDYLEHDAWLLYYADEVKTRNQYHEHRFSGLRMEGRYTYRLCPDLEVSFVGPELTFTDEYGTLSRRYEKQTGQLLVHTSFEMPARRVPAEEIEGFSRFLEALLGSTDIWFRIRRATGGAEQAR